MKLLFSPTSVAEARVTLDSPVDVIDIKNPDEGSLGCQHPVVAAAIVDLAHGAGREVSIAIGDLHHQPGTAAMAAFAAAQLGADYVKAGLRGSATVPEAKDLLQWIVESIRMVRCGNVRANLAEGSGDTWPDHPFTGNSRVSPTEGENFPTGDKPWVVACGYADHLRFGGLSPQEVLSAAVMAQCDYVMLDTLTKDGLTLFDHLTRREVGEFCASAHSQGLKVALAGSLQVEHLPALAEMQPDFIGVRGAICENSNRGGAICPRRTRAFADAATVASRS